ncbi:unnamed protein product, partial [Scytosiphon promiscuus]
VSQPLSDKPAPLRRSVESYRLGMEACRKGGDTRAVLSTFAVMRQEGFEPNLACYNEALKACAEGGGRFERAASFLKEMGQAGVAPNTESYRAALRACESCPDQDGAAKAAFDIIRTMTPFSTHGAADPTVGTARAEGRGQAPLGPPNARDYLAALRACAGDGDGCNGNPALALRLLTDLKVCVVEARAAAAAAEGKAAEGKVDAPQSLGSGASSDSSREVGPLLPEHYCAAMGACGRGGDTQGILDLLSELRRAGDVEGTTQIATAAAAAGLRLPPSKIGAPDESADGQEREGLPHDGRDGEDSKRAAEATRAALAAGVVPTLSPALYAAATSALADVGEWEWCLVLLEELEQYVAEQEEDRDANDDAPDAEIPGEEDGAVETVLRVELDESGTPVDFAGTSSATTVASVAAETSAAYTATVRACGRGRAGVQAVVGVLERTRWAGIEAGEDAYVAAISAYRACGGAWEGVPQGRSAGVSG